MRLMRVIGAIVATALVAATLATAALAQSPSGTGYGGGANVVGGVRGEGTAPTRGTLPFTGIDLALLVAGGVVLAAVGAGLVRATARR